MKKGHQRRAFNWESFCKYLIIVIDQKKYDDKENYSYREMSKICGASFSSIYRVTKGKKIDLDNLILLTDWLDMNINDFIK